MFPESELSVRQRKLRVVTFSKAGIGPDKEFIWRSILVSLDELEKSLAGICPDRLLRDRISMLREGLLAKESGITPVRVLFARLT